MCKEQEVKTSVDKAYCDFMDEISADELYEGLLAYSFFAEKIPPVFTSVPFFEYCKSVSFPFKPGWDDYISFRVMRNISIPSIWGQPPLQRRKFGMFLWISSQRPSDISSTIISQMHNYFIHKLVNPFDLNRIRKAVAFLDQNAMDTVTVLGPGECVVSGTGVNMPCFMKVEQLEMKNRPNSENVLLFGEGGILEESFDPLDFDSLFE